LICPSKARGLEEICAGVFLLVAEAEDRVLSVLLSCLFLFLPLGAAVAFTVCWIANCLLAALVGA